MNSCSPFSPPPALARTSNRLTLLFCFLSALALAATGATAATNDVGFGPYFLGYETEPAMEYGGRTLSSLCAGISDPVFSLLGPIRGASAAADFLLAIGLSTVQHEVFGHGSRAREYSLDPSYGFGLDFSAYTTLKKDPQSIEQILVMSAGGTEADGILADRILRDLSQPNQASAALIPLMFIAKADLSLYSLVTSDPAEAPDPNADTSFGDEYEEGNDIAIYTVSRQAQRKGNVTAVSVWERDYRIDYADPLLRDNWKDAQAAGIWNMADPMMWTSMFLYVRDHLIGGQHFISTPGLPIADGLAVNVGTRAALGPQSISRFLDLYGMTPLGTARLYGREIRSSSDISYGIGGGLYGARPLPGVQFSLSADQWSEPAAPENLYSGSAWNVCAEVTKSLARACGLTAKAGYKTEGFLPGAPVDSGAYWGGGLTVVF